MLFFSLSLLTSALNAILSGLHYESAIFITIKATPFRLYLVDSKRFA